MLDLTSDCGLLQRPDPICDFKRQIERVENARSPTSACWVISGDIPVRTVESPGEYRTNSKDATPVVAELTMKWAVKTPDSKTTKRFPTFFVDTKDGNAWIRVALRCVMADGNLADAVAVWRSDIGSPAKDYCLFHSQIPGDELEQVEPGTCFPDDLGVPRFPDLFMTPMAVLEFVLGELFPQRWDEALRGGRGTADWRSIQRNRWKAVIGWQEEAIKNPILSPWFALRAHRPNTVLLDT